MSLKKVKSINLLFSFTNFRKKSFYLIAIHNNPLQHHGSCLHVLYQLYSKQTPLLIYFCNRWFISTLLNFSENTFLYELTWLCLWHFFMHSLGRVMWIRSYIELSVCLFVSRWWLPDVKGEDLSTPYPSISIERSLITPSKCFHLDRIGQIRFWYLTVTLCIVWHLWRFINSFRETQNRHRFRFTLNFHNNYEQNGV